MIDSNNSCSNNKDNISILKKIYFALCAVANVFTLCAVSNVFTLG